MSTGSVPSISGAKKKDFVAALAIENEYSSMRKGQQGKLPQPLIVVFKLLSNLLLLPASFLLSMTGDDAYNNSKIQGDAPQDTSNEALQDNHDPQGAPKKDPHAIPMSKKSARKPPSAVMAAEVMIPPPQNNLAVSPQSANIAFVACYSNEEAGLGWEIRQITTRILVEFLILDLFYAGICIVISFFQS